MHPGFNTTLSSLKAEPAGQKRRDSRGEAGQARGHGDRNEWSAAFAHGGDGSQQDPARAILHSLDFAIARFTERLRRKGRISIRDLAARVSQVVERETASCATSCAVMASICFGWHRPIPGRQPRSRVQGPTEAQHASCYHVLIA